MSAKTQENESGETKNTEIRGFDFNTRKIHEMRAKSQGDGLRAGEYFSSLLGVASRTMKSNSFPQPSTPNPKKFKTQ